MTAPSWRATERVLLVRRDDLLAGQPLRHGDAHRRRHDRLAGRGLRRGRPPGQRRPGRRPAGRARHARLRRRARARHEHRADPHRPRPVADDARSPRRSACSRRGRATCAARAIIGHGWDETRWPEGRPPSREEVDRATWGSVVYLSRIDVHSAVVSSALVAQVPGVPRPARLRRDGAAEPAGAPRRPRGHPRDDRRGPAGGGAPGHARARRLARHRRHARDGRPDDLQRGRPRRAARPRRRRARPDSSSATGASWRARAASSGPAPSAPCGVAGDLFVDGAIGSRTACLCEPYADAPDRTGAALPRPPTRSPTTWRRRPRPGCRPASTSSATPPARPSSRAARGRRARRRCRRCGQRCTGSSMPSCSPTTTSRAMADLGVTASMQPMFDGLWGGPGGMYEQRLGAARAARHEPVRRPRVRRRPGGLRLRRPRHRAGPVGGRARRRAPHHPGAGAVRAGGVLRPHPRRLARRRAAGHRRARARSARPLAVWAVDDIVVQAPDERLAAWSTDPRCGTPGLPRPRPGPARCRRACARSCTGARSSTAATSTQCMTEPSATPLLRLPVAALAAVGAGVLLWLAFPPGGASAPAPPAGSRCSRRRCGGPASARGRASACSRGVVFFALLLDWMRVIGPDAWLLLTLLCASWIALLGRGHRPGHPAAGRPGVGGRRCGCSTRPCGRACPSAASPGGTWPSRSPTAPSAAGRPPAARRS